MGKVIKLSAWRGGKREKRGALAKGMIDTRVVRKAQLVGAAKAVRLGSDGWRPERVQLDRQTQEEC